MLDEEYYCILLEISLPRLGDCIALFGINPAYRPSMKGFYETEIELPMESLEKWKKIMNNLN